MIENLHALGVVARTAISRRLNALPKFSEWDYRQVETSVELPCRPAIFQIEQMDRVIQCGFGASLEGELQKISAKYWRTSPASVYDLKDVLVLGGHVFHHGERNLLRDYGLLRLSFRSIQRFDSVVVPNSFLGLHFFGHWLRDDCSGFELARSMGRIVSVRRPFNRDAAAYSEFLSQSWDEQDGFFARSSTFISDIGFSPKKGERLRVLRARLRKRIGQRIKPEIAFIRRGNDDPNRNPRNEDQLLVRLASLGVRIVDGSSPISEVLGQVLDADIIVGLEGSQLAHAVLVLKEGGALIVLQSPFRFYNPHYEWVRLLEMNYGTVVGTVAEDGFTVNFDDVARMIDRMALELHARSAS